ncbi:MAG: VTT domain-containing protein [Hyphomicrobiales bacterium]|nr:VTT domain-containing protein [Hyphomicrobiales bacterium]
MFSKKILLIIYSLALLLFLYLIFNKYTFIQIVTLEFAPILKADLLNITGDNHLYIVFLLIILGLFWSFFLGFTSPIAVFCGMILGNYFGSLIAIVGLTLGSTFLYVSAQNFFSQNLSKISYNKFEKIRSRFHNNELIFFILYRIFVGIPFGLSNVIAVIFNVKLYNFILGTAIGMFPSVFIWASIGKGFNKLVIKENEFPNYLTIITSSETQLPLIGFLVFFIILLIAKVFINQKKSF